MGAEQVEVLHNLKKWKLQQVCERNTDSSSNNKGLTCKLGQENPVLGTAM